jgi:hypothetical protein
VQADAARPWFIANICSGFVWVIAVPHTCPPLLPFGVSGRGDLSAVMQASQLGGRRRTADTDAAMPARRVGLEPLSPFSHALYRVGKHPAPDRLLCGLSRMRWSVTMTKC